MILQDPVTWMPRISMFGLRESCLGMLFSGLNPSDIDQIDVLKDASATAIYGPKASNGGDRDHDQKGESGETCRDL